MRNNPGMHSDVEIFCLIFPSFLAFSFPLLNLFNYFRRSSITTIDLPKSIADSINAHCRWYGDSFVANPYSPPQISFGFLCKKLWKFLNGTMKKIFFVTNFHKNWFLLIFFVGNFFFWCWITKSSHFGFHYLFSCNLLSFYFIKNIIYKFFIMSTEDEI